MTAPYLLNLCKYNTLPPTLRVYPFEGGIQKKHSNIYNLLSLEILRLLGAIGRTFDDILKFDRTLNSCYEV